MSKYVLSDDQGNAFMDSSTKSLFEDVESACTCADEWVREDPSIIAYVSEVKKVFKIKETVEVEVIDE